jgi:hypothetical protein
MSQSSALEQYMLELVNAERAKAGAQPLASNSTLNDAADTQSQWMIDTDTFSHTGAGGTSPTDRMASAGYDFNGSWASAENIGWVSAHDPAGLQDEVQQLHTNLMNSPGHHANLMNPDLREVGIGIADGDYKSWDGVFVTQDFAKTSTGPFLTGVAFDDKDGDHAYDPGEGLGGIAVTVTDSAGHVFEATTNDAGGYDLALGRGVYTVTFSGGAVAESTHQVTIADANVKLDLVDPAAAPAQPETATHDDPAAGPTETASTSDPGTDSAPGSDANPAPNDTGAGDAPTQTTDANPAPSDAGAGDAPTETTETQPPAEDTATPATPGETTDSGAETTPADPVGTHEDAPAGEAGTGSPAHDFGHRMATWWQNLDRFDFRSDHGNFLNQDTAHASAQWDVRNVADFLKELQHSVDTQTGNVDQVIHEAVSQFVSDLQSKCAGTHDFFHL